jgi:hypothetical protein
MLNSGNVIGKPPQVITLLDTVLTHFSRSGSPSAIKRILILVPKSLKNNWVREV